MSFAFPIEGQANKFIAALGRKLAVIQWNGKTENATVEEVIAEVDTEEEFKSNRLNGGKVDPYGRLWAGVLHEILCETKIYVFFQEQWGQMAQMARQSLKEEVCTV